MRWLVFLSAIQILGFGFTLLRLAYDEWQQWQLSKIAAVSEDRQHNMELQSWEAATIT